MGDAGNLIIAVMTVIKSCFDMLYNVKIFGDYSFVGIIVTFFVIEVALNFIFELLERAWYGEGEFKSEGEI